ncbi:ECF sigma factor [Planctomycetes bacterium Poly30]|uniref:ECF sigma factor n=1 Tax=Saltatorellus ferox TaxID=2528018 RepID=A0A518EX07_9BACT|nr:ECF sigma factor [Planctomycetes bacterium Poly30]
MASEANRPHFLSELFEQVQVELRRLSTAAMNQERSEHTLQPTALMNELWIRLQTGGAEMPVDKGPFLGLAAKVMRQVLVDHARAKNRLKRSGGWRPVTIAVAEGLAAGEGGDGEEEIDVVDLDLALADLREVSERQAEVVELRFFAGLEVDDVAAALGISPRTVAREWRFAKAWLHKRMGELE